MKQAVSVLLVFCPFRNFSLSLELDEFIYHCYHSCHTNENEFRSRCQLTFQQIISKYLIGKFQDKIRFLFSNLEKELASFFPLGRFPIEVNQLLFMNLLFFFRSVGSEQMSRNYGAAGISPKNLDRLRQGR